MFLVCTTDAMELEEIQPCVGDCRTLSAPLDERVQTTFRRRKETAESVGVRAL